jgi:Protein of unknown function (DUF3761)
MRLTNIITTLAAGLLCAAASVAQAPATAPSGSTGACKDGTYTSSATKKGACSGHQGVQTWYGSGTAAAAAPATAAAPAAAPAAPPPAAKPAPTASAPAATPAGGGGPGQVWVNTQSKVYHCSGDRWYGKTKEGQYMTEADATAKGFRPDHGKACK